MTTTKDSGRIRSEQRLGDRDTPPGCTLGSIDPLRRVRVADVSGTAT